MTTPTISIASRNPDGTAQLRSPEGRSVVRCWQPRPGHFYPAALWTEDEAAEHARTGEIPQRIREAWLDMPSTGVTGE